MGSQPKQQLCWDCAKACGGCSWSQTFDPVPGWTATPTHDNSGAPSYCITDCPEFVRDAWCNGTRRKPPLTPEQKARLKAQRATANKYRRMGREVPKDVQDELQAGL